MITTLFKVLNLPNKSEDVQDINEDISRLKSIVEASRNIKQPSFDERSTNSNKTEFAYNDSVNSLLDICRLLMRQGDSLLAIKQIKRFLFTEPRSLESHSFISLLYLKMGNYNKSYDHIMGVRFMTDDNNYDAKIASASIMDTLIYQVCKLPLGLKSKSLIGYKFEDELPFNEKSLEYMYPYRFEKMNSSAFYNSSTVDRFLTPVSTQQINVGDLVHTEEPYALAPEIPSDLSIQITCFHCLREREVYDHAFSCSVHPNTCPFVFCRWECMIKHSRRHELECEYIGNIIVLSSKSNLPISFLLLSLRCLLQTYLDSISLRNKNDGVSLKILDLPSYSEIIEIISPQLFLSFEIVTEEFINIIPPHQRLFFTKKELKLFLMSLYSNKLPVLVTSASSAFNSSPIPISTGLGFFAKACKFQHSCIPSCVYYLNEDHKLCIRSAYNIPENSTLTISYIFDLYQPTFKRKSIQNGCKIFLCMCSRCLDDTENELYLEGIRCPFCITGFFVPVPNFKKDELRENENIHSIKSVVKSSFFKKINIFNKDKILKDNSMYSGNKIDDKLTPELKMLCERARIGCKSGEIQTKWKCNNCGEYSNEINEYCDELVLKMENHHRLAVESFNGGQSVEARKLFEKFVSNYSLLIHKNHYILYNSRSHLVGLYNFTNSNDSKISYKYCKPIVISANMVFPVCYHEKVHLFLNLADTIYKKEMIQKVSQRGLFNNSKELIMECSWLSLFNSFVCYGPKSPIYYYCLSRMRLYSSILGVTTPPSNMRIRITSIDLFAKLNREILGNSTISKNAEYLSTLTEYSALLFIASIKGHLKGIAQLLVGEVKEILLNQVTYLPTGLNLLGMAANNLREDVCALLLEEGSDLFFKNEYGITPIHALCLFPTLNEEQYLNNQNDKKAAIIAKEMIRKACILDNEYELTNNQIILREINNKFGLNNKLNKENVNGVKEINIPSKGSNRYKLLYGKTIKWLGSNTPLHIAAYKGRKILCSELIHGGTDPNVENIELATPLHLASMNGHNDTVNLLLKYGSEVDKENYQGNTPLLLSMYGLKYETIRTLLDKGANLSHRSDILKMNVIHMLILGLCCNTALNFQLPKKLDDLPLISHNGYNNKDLKTYIYSMGTSHTGFGSNSSTKVLSIPVQTPIAELLYISPREILIRLKSCFDIMSYLNNIYDITPLLIQKDLNGFTPYELLNSIWNDFLKIRNESMSNQGLWYSSLSDNDKNATEELWSHIMQRVERLLETIRAEANIYDINEDDPELELPIPDKELKGIPDLVVKEKTEYLRRRGYVEPSVLKKGSYNEYCLEYGPISRTDSQIKELKDLILKRRKEQMELNTRKDRVFKNVAKSGKGLLESKLPTSQGKSVMATKSTNLLLKPKSSTLTDSASNKTSKTIKTDGTLLKVKDSDKSRINSKPTLKPKLESNSIDKSPKKLVIKNSSSPSSPLPSPTSQLQLKKINKITPLDISSKQLKIGTKPTPLKLDLSKMNLATPKKIEIKTNLIQPKTVAKIVVKSKLVPKKL